MVLVSFVNKRMVLGFILLEACLWKLLQNVIFKMHPTYEVWFCEIPAKAGAVLLHPSFCSEVEGLKRKLTSKLGANSTGLVPDWQVVCFHVCFWINSGGVLGSDSSRESMYI